MTDHFEESTITGTRQMPGSDATRRRKVVMARSASSIPSSMFTSMIWAPLSTCCPGHLERLLVMAFQDQLREAA
jgi:hypothetical protein